MKLLCTILMSLSLFSYATEIPKKTETSAPSGELKRDSDIASENSQEKLFIESDKAISAYIMNFDGKKVGTFAGNELDVSNLPSGSYWINIKENSKTFRYPIVIR